VHAVPAAEDVPAGQLAQTVDSVHKLDVAPITGYFPRGQDTSSVQAAVGSPVVDPYLPAGHGEHVADPARE
jgi:hypothetical protein